MLDARKVISSVSSKGHPRSIPSLDGLRAIAVSTVIVAHCAVPEYAAFQARTHHLHSLERMVSIDWGDLGVSVFFVISGFLITTLLVKRPTLPSLSDFYTRRFFRIFPPYYLYLAVLGIVWLAGAAPMLRGAFFSAVLYVSNYYPYSFSEPAARGWLVGHTWSLSLEEQFYLFWPCVLLRWGRRRAIWIGIGILFLSPCMRLLTIHVAPWTLDHSQVDRMFHTRMDTIITGCILALLPDWPRAYALLGRAVRYPWLAFAATGALWLILIEDKSHFRTMQAIGMTVDAILLGYLIFYVVQNDTRWMGRLLNLAPLRHIGMISYSLYLWQQFFTGASPFRPHHLWETLMLTICCAEASYHFIELPSLRIRDAYLARRRRLLRE